MKIAFVEIANFRKLESVRIEISDDKTVFVGANNSGKTSAMLALKLFLTERDKIRFFSLADFTISHWHTIDEQEEKWKNVKSTDDPLPEFPWKSISPFLDVWLSVEKNEAYLVRKLIPTLDWEGNLLGVRLKLEPKDSLQLQKNYLVARDKAREHEQRNQPENGATEKNKTDNKLLWPRTLKEYLERRFKKDFSIKSYILDPAKLLTPQQNKVTPQALSPNATPIDGEPFKGLIRIDEISAQRGLGNSDGTKDFNVDELSDGSLQTRRMAKQLYQYWNKHLNPLENPEREDIKALETLEEAKKVFDKRLKDDFSDPIKEIEEMGYPGISDPKVRLSSQFKPIDGLNHDAAVQYVVPFGDEENETELTLPENSNGLGFQNLIFMLFRLMSFRDAWVMKGKEASESDVDSDNIIPPLHLVLIEEPEVHLHPQAQQVFIRKAYNFLRKNEKLGNSTALNTQLIVSTHSSHIAYECDFNQLRYFRRLPSAKKTVPTSCVINLGATFGDKDNPTGDSDKSTRRFVERYIKITHCDLLFADAAIFVEGAAERMLVPFFVRNNKNKKLSPLQKYYITWLEIGGSHAHRLRPLIEQLGLSTLIITDLDAMDEKGKKVTPQRKQSLKTRNKTLEEWCPQEKDLYTLLKLNDDKKSKWYEEQNFSIYVSYQSPITITLNDKKIEALSDTFENALIMQNLELFAKNSKNDLWKKITDETKDCKTSEELNKSIDSILKNVRKAEFALNFLELENPKDLTPPSYILNGLNWLLDQLNKKEAIEN